MIQVFSKEWFDLYQKKLLWLANTVIGRCILRIHGDRSSVGTNKIIRIAPNAITWLVEDRGEEVELKTEFRTNDKFARRLYYVFKPLWLLLHGWDWLTFRRPAWNTGFDTLTQYPGTIAAGNPMDGYAARDGISESFATIRAGAGSANSTGFLYLYLGATTTSNQFGDLRRSLICYDTSALTSVATITAATLSVYDILHSAGLGTTTLDVVASTPANTNALANADYGQLGTTVFGQIAWASINTGGYNDFTLDANGRGNISKTAVSKFGARLGWDTSGTFSGSWASSQVTRFAGYSASATGTDNDPKLVVTYTLPSASFRMMTGIGN